jgi:hypothetical protein
MYGLDVKAIKGGLNTGVKITIAAALEIQIFSREGS